MYSIAGKMTRNFKKSQETGKIEIHAKENMPDMTLTPVLKKKYRIPSIFSHPIFSSNIYLHTYYFGVLILVYS